MKTNVLLAGLLVLLFSDILNAAVIENKPPQRLPLASAEELQDFAVSHHTLVDVLLRYVETNGSPNILADSFMLTPGYTNFQDGVVALVRNDVTELRNRGDCASTVGLNVMINDLFQIEVMPPGIETNLGNLNDITDDSVRQATATLTYDPLIEYLADLRMFSVYVRFQDGTEYTNYWDSSLPGFVYPTLSSAETVSTNSFSLGPELSSPTNHVRLTIQVGEKTTTYTQYGDPLTSFEAAWLPGSNMIAMAVPRGADIGARISYDLSQEKWLETELGYDVPAPEQLFVIVLDRPQVFFQWYIK